MAVDFQSDIKDLNIVKDDAAGSVQRASAKIQAGAKAEADTKRQFNLFVAQEGIKAGSEIYSEIFGDKVKGVMTRLEGHGAEAIAAEQRIDEILNNIDKGTVKTTLEGADTAGIFSAPVDVRTGEQVDLMAENTSKMLKQYAEDTREELNALAGGILTRDQATREIASLTKQYIARMPGLAPMIRAKAAEITGINNFDSLLEKNALTTETQEEKNAAAQAKADLEIIKAVAKHNGVLPSQVNNSHINIWRTFQMEKNADESLQMELREQDLRQEKVDEHQSTRVHLKLAGSAYNLTAAVTDAISQLSSPDSEGEWLKLRTEMLPKVRAMIEQERGRLNSFTSSLLVKTADNPNPISSTKAKEMHETIDKSFTDLLTYFDEADKFDYFINLARATEMNAELFQNSLTVSNPFFAVMERLRIGPNLVELFLSSPGDNYEAKREYMRGAHGDLIADGIYKIITNPGYNMFSINSAKKNVSSDPTEHSNMDEQIEEATAVAPTPKEKREVLEAKNYESENIDVNRNETNAHTFINNMTTTLVEDGISPTDLDRQEAFIQEGKFETAMQKLSPEKRKNHANTVLDKLGTRYTLRAEQLVSRLTGPESKYFTNPGWIQWIPEMGQFDYPEELSHGMKAIVNEMNTALRIAKAYEQYGNEEYKDLGGQISESLRETLSLERIRLMEEKLVLEQDLKAAQTRLKEFNEFDKANPVKDRASADYQRRVQKRSNVAAGVTSVQGEIKDKDEGIQRVDHLMERMFSVDDTSQRPEGPARQEVSGTISQAEESKPSEPIEPSESAVAFSKVRKYALDIARIQSILLSQEANTMNKAVLDSLRENLDITIGKRFDPALLDQLTPEQKEELATLEEDFNLSLEDLKKRYKELTKEM